MAETPARRKRTTQTEDPQPEERAEVASALAAKAPEPEPEPVVEHRVTGMQPAQYEGHPWGTVPMQMRNV